MSLTFFDCVGALNIRQVESPRVDHTGLRITITSKLSHDPIIFDLSIDDATILNRHLTAYVQTGELMRV